MFGLTTLGVIHTAISLIAVAAGAIAVARTGAISPNSRVGRIYVVTTILTCVTGFGIFQHGGFGKPHALGIVTLAVLGVAALAARTKWFGRASPHVVMVCLTTTFFFHLVPGITETVTRLPRGAPWVGSPEAPELQRAIGVVLVLFLIGVALQVRRLRAAVNPRGGT